MPAAALLVAVFLLSCARADAAPSRYALLIGINEYASDDVVDLRGAVNDVTMLRRILMSRFGFADDDIVVMTDEDATREAILDALADLVARVNEDDFVYIHYSGHGSQIKDFNGDEDDGLDETILPHDARTDGVPDIVDDEFEGLFGKLKSHNVFIVFDSCHSGTVTRSVAAVRPRFAPPDDRLELYKRFSAATREVVLVNKLPHVLMSGAPSGEEALDGPVDGGWYGLFSYAMARSLDALGPTATPAQLHRSVKAELHRIQEQVFAKPPEPQLEGPQERISVPMVPPWMTGNAAPAVAQSNGSTDTPASSVEEPRRAWLESRIIDAGHVLLVDGAQLNARPGSQWGIYEPGEADFHFGDALALGTVQSMQGDDAVLSLQVQSGELPENGRAISIVPPELAERIPVRLIADSKRQADMQDAIQAASTNVVFVKDDEFARFIVELEHSEWRVRDAGGLQTPIVFPDSETKDVAANLAGYFASSATAIALLGLRNGATELELELNAVTEANAGSTTTDFAPRYRIKKGDERRSATNSLMIEARVDKDAYLSVIDIDTEGHVSLLFPNSAQRPEFLPDGFVRANTTVRIPDSLANGNRAGFHWDYGPPAGTDNIRVFATRSLDVAETIRRLAGQVEDHREAASELRSVLAGAAVRGVRVVADESQADDSSAFANPQGGSDDWTVASIVIDVQD